MSRGRSCSRPRRIPSPQYAVWTLIVNRPSRTRGSVRWQGVTSPFRSTAAPTYCVSNDARSRVARPRTRTRSSAPLRAAFASLPRCPRSPRRPSGRQGTVSSPRVRCSEVHVASTPSRRVRFRAEDDGKGAAAAGVGGQVNIVAISGGLQSASSNSALLRGIGAAACASTSRCGMSSGSSRISAPTGRAMST